MTKHEFDMFLWHKGEKKKSDKVFTWLLRIFVVAPFFLIIFIGIANLIYIAIVELT